MPRGSRPGERRGGRKKGTPNRTTATAREAVQRTFEGIGGVPNFITWAGNNETEFYKLFARLIPVQQELSGKDGGPIQTETQTVDWGALKLVV